jgi:hypothetical protein
MTDSKLDRARTLARQATSRLRTWFDPPLEADARPLEIREAIIDHVERLTEPAAAGRRLLPHAHLTVTVLAETKDAREPLQAALADIEPAICQRLAELRCPVPHGFSVAVHFTKKPRADWPGGQRFSVDERRTSTGAAGSPRTIPTLRLTVVRGKASQSAYVFNDARVLIGRTESPVDDAGRPRRNHVAFLDEGGHNATVGRAHASIRFDTERRQFRIFDDGSHNGTRVIRQGETLDVMPRNPVGVALLPGDEIQFGTAAVIVEIE